MSRRWQSALQRISLLALCSSLAPAQAESAAAAAYRQQLPALSALPSFPQPGDHAAWQALRQRLDHAARTAARAQIQHSGVTLAEQTIAGMTVLTLTPPQLCYRQVLLYLHGGAFTLGSAHSSSALAARVALRLGMQVLVADYAKAPQQQWQQIQHSLLQLTSELNALYPHGLVYFGDSAGANLATVLALRTPQAPQALLLWSPWAELGNTGDSRDSLSGDDPYFSYSRHLARAAAAYAVPADWQHPWVSPVYAQYSAQFPPTLIQSGSRELLLSDSIRLYRSMADSGAPVQLDLYDGMLHVFAAALPQAPETQLLLKQMARFLAQKLPMPPAQQGQHQHCRSSD
jgi:monoterpene epsilon-lactone hydrolase